MKIQPSPRSIEGRDRHKDGTLRPFRRYLIGGGARPGGLMTIQPSPRSIEGGARHQDGTLRPYRRYLIGGGALILVLAAFYWWTHSGNQAGPRRTPIVPV